MRAKVFLRAEKNAVIPVNYQHHLSSAIYYFIEENNPDLSSSLHHSRRFKFFNFSNLKIDRKKVEGEKIHIYPGALLFNFSSPNSEILKATITGMLQTGEITIGKERLAIDRIEILETPQFGTTALFRTLSPVYIDSGEKPRRDLLPDDPRWKKRLEENTARKYEEYTGKKPPGPTKIGDVYWFRRKRIKIRESWWHCANAEFTVQAPPEILLFIWETGIGNKNSQGFGCLEMRG